MLYLGILVLGFVSGLRTLTGLAVLAVFLRGGIVGALGVIGAIGEYAADLSPRIPPRTALPSIVVRPLSGALAGYWFDTAHGGAGIAGALLGIAGALAGTYGGYAARVGMIARIGDPAAGVLEDVVAIVLALVAVKVLY